MQNKIRRREADRDAMAGGDEPEGPGERSTRAAGNPNAERPRIRVGDRGRIGPVQACGCGRMLQNPGSKMHIAATTYDEAPLSTTANPGFLRMSALRGDCSRLRLKKLRTAPEGWISAGPESRFEEVFSVPT